MRDVVKALREKEGDQAKAAEAVGISRQAIRYHIKKFFAGLDLGYWGG